MAISGYSYCEFTNLNGNQLVSRADTDRVFIGTTIAAFMVSKLKFRYSQTKSVYFG